MPTTSSSTGEKSPNSAIERIPLGVVGLNFGRWMVLDYILKAPASNYFDLIALCDAVPSKLDALKAELGEKFNGKLYTSLDELLEDPEIKTVALFSGPVKRADLIRKIIRKGKDVITTKPLELDAEAALAVLKEAKEIGRVVVLNSPAPDVAPDIAQILKWQKEFDLGPAIAARTSATASYFEKADGGWYDKPELCPVAPIFRIGIYPINDLCNFFHEPESVFVQHSRLRTGRPTPDHAQLGIRYKNGALANVFASFCIHDGDQYRNSLVLNFERGTVHRETGPVRGKSPKLTLIKGDDKYVRYIAAEAEIENTSGSYYWSKFYDLMKGKTLPNMIPDEQIVESIRIINAMSRAELGNGWANI